MGFNIKLLEVDKCPPADIAICSECGKRWPIEQCPTEQEGDWESGYYDAPICPECEDGGLIEDYDYTPEQAKKLDEWFKKQGV